ncbi:MAG: hypothetical protein LBI99_04055 [Propionibacteriaceae bacterium]|jgi:uncharacterized protein YgbK (DUF1537 family)|nr:hypothetical protein [Propionibacteriaceae bacterium]
MNVSQAELLASYPPECPVRPEAVQAALDKTILIVADDDPTGTQAVHDVIALTAWEVSDFAWAFAEITRLGAAPAIFVETNSRSLDPGAAARCNAELVRNAVTAAREAGAKVRFASRSDSTLRGHFPLETDVISDTLAKLGEPPVDAVLLALAFPEAGRVTIGGTHYLRLADGGLCGAGESEFARDATFGYRSSRLADYASERTGTHVEVTELDLGTIRSGPDAVAAALRRLADRRTVAADAVGEDDLRSLALGVLCSGKNVLPRSGPPFIRALIGQAASAPLQADDIFSDQQQGAVGGLIVVGSHVGVSSRQLERLRTGAPNTVAIELRVADLLGQAAGQQSAPEQRGDTQPPVGEGIQKLAESIVSTLAESNVVLFSSREVVTGNDAADSLEIARRVSGALTEITAAVVDATRPRFVIAKGGITSSDLARGGLRMRRAVVRGCLQPGIIALWQGADGPGAGIPYVVFAGNVGTDAALLEVVELLSSPTLVGGIGAEGEAK